MSRRSSCFAILSRLSRLVIQIIIVILTTRTEFGTTKDPRQFRPVLTMRLNIYHLHVLLVFSVLNYSPPRRRYVSTVSKTEHRFRTRTQLAGNPINTSDRRLFSSSFFIPNDQTFFFARKYINIYFTIRS